MLVSSEIYIKLFKMLIAFKTYAKKYPKLELSGETHPRTEQDLLGQVSRLRKREGQKYVNFYGKS